MKIKTVNEFYFNQHSKNSMFVIRNTIQILDFDIWGNWEKSILQSPPASYSFFPSEDAIVF